MILLLNARIIVRGCFQQDKGTPNCPGTLKGSMSSICAGGSAVITSALCIEFPIIGCFVGGAISYISCKYIDGTIETSKNCIPYFAGSYLKIKVLLN